MTLAPDLGFEIAFSQFSVDAPRVYREFAGNYHHVSCVMEAVNLLICKSGRRQRMK
jgi:hypothetical protein